MPTIEEMVDDLEATDLEADAQPEPEAPLPPIELPPEAVQWIARKIAEPQRLNDYEIAAQANEKLGDWGIEVMGKDAAGNDAIVVNPIKPSAHVARIRAARNRRLAAIKP